MTPDEPLDGTEICRLDGAIPQEPLPELVGDDKVVPCPGCGSTHVITGTSQSWRGDKAGGFEPDNLRWLQLLRLRRSGVKFEGQFRACLRCGLVWSSVSPEELAALIEKYGTDEAKDRLPGTQPE